MHGYLTYEVRKYEYIYVRDIEKKKIKKIDDISQNGKNSKKVEGTNKYKSRLGNMF